MRPSFRKLEGSFFCACSLLTHKLLSKTKQQGSVNAKGIAHSQHRHPQKKGKYKKKNKKKNKNKNKYKNKNKNKNKNKKVFCCCLR